MLIIIIQSIAFSLAIGINLFGSLLLISILVCLDIFTIPEFSFFANKIFISAIFILFICEFFIDKIKGFDCALDSILFFSKIPIASFLCFLLAVKEGILLQTLLFTLGAIFCAASHFIKLGAKIIINTADKPYKIWVFSLVGDFLLLAILLSAIYNHLVFFTILTLYITFISWFLPEIFRGIRNITLVVYGILTGIYKKSRLKKL